MRGRDCENTVWLKIMKNQIDKVTWAVLPVAIVLFVLSMVYQGWFNVAFNVLMSVMFIYAAKKSGQSWNLFVGIVFGLLALLGTWQGLR